MNYRTLGKTGAQVSEIGFGSWALGGRTEAAGVPWGWGEVDRKDAIAALRKAHELGVNFFDTADVYGNGRSEEMLGEALAGATDVIIASKVGNVVRDGKGGKDWSRSHITWSCEQTLKKLRREVLDLYQLHNPNVEDIENGDWPETMERLVESGKIRWYGVSVFLPEEAQAVLKRGAGHTIQLAYNALRQEMEAEVLPSAQETEFGIIARVPLYYGILTGKYTAETAFPGDDHRSHTLPPETMSKLVPRADRLKQIAERGPTTRLSHWSLQFVLSHPAVSTVIPGARNAAQAEENCRALQSMAPQEQFSEARQLYQRDEYLRSLRTEL